MNARAVHTVQRYLRGRTSTKVEQKLLSFVPCGTAQGPQNSFGDKETAAPAATPTPRSQHQHHSSNTNNHLSISPLLLPQLITLFLLLLFSAWATTKNLSAKKPPVTHFWSERITNMPLSASALGPSRAPTPSQTKTGSRRQFILYNKTDNDITKELKTSTGPKSAPDAV